ncbi:RNA-binding protein PNO1-like [Hibiscus syriacus]|uniref:RNA-binding protein PNO1-like n=1 Tax=Hibiscus syriacus TaxID=106335 RepID=UPI00192343A3|nr:RNA-binding protein PNO1-like [Hibiscus syriacus]
MSTEAPTTMETETAASEPKLESNSLPPKPKFEPLKAHEMSDGRVQFRKVSVPPHRYSPLKKYWMDIYTPIYEQMKIDIQMNLKARKVELKTRLDTPDISTLSKLSCWVSMLRMLLRFPGPESGVEYDRLEPNEKKEARAGVKESQKGALDKFVSKNADSHETLNQSTENLHIENLGNSENVNDEVNDPIDENVENLGIGEETLPHLNIYDPIN